jgi:hypothetical protein
VIDFDDLIASSGQQDERILEEDGGRKNTPKTLLDMFEEALDGKEVFHDGEGYQGSSDKIDDGDNTNKD